jgi:hypothetical protein
MSDELVAILSPITVDPASTGCYAPPRTEARQPPASRLDVRTLYRLDTTTTPSWLRPGSRHRHPGRDRSKAPPNRFNTSRCGAYGPGPGGPHSSREVRSVFASPGSGRPAASRPRIEEAAAVAPECVTAGRGLWAAGAAQGLRPLRASRGCDMLVAWAQPDCPDSSGAGRRGGGSGARR